MADSRTYRSADTPTLGMRGSQNWTASEAPDSYREMILWLYPNGMAPLTAMLSKLKNTKEDQSHFHWFTKTLPVKAGAITNTYTDILTTDLATGAVTDGMTLYVACAAALAEMIRVGHEVLLRLSTNHDKDLVGKVLDVQVNGANSYIKVETIVQGTYGNAVEYDRLLICGNINPEASTRPAAISYNATEFGNYQQIFRTAMTISRNANIKNRLGDPYQNLKKETLEDHSIELEWAFLHGQRGWKTGPNGMPERTTQGIIPFLRANAPTNVLQCQSIAGMGWNGKTWGGSTGYGVDCVEYLIRRSFEYGKSTDKTVLCGAGVLANVQTAVRGNSNYNIQSGISSYGIKVTRMESVFGNWNFVTAPLWTQESSQTNSLLAFDAANLEYKYALDTKFEKDDRFGKGGGDGLDGIVEGFITEAGLALYHPQTFIYASNFGSTNSSGS